MSEDPSVNILNLEIELVNHLTSKANLEAIVRENISDQILILPHVKSALAFAREYYSKSSDAPTIDVINTEFPNKFQLSEPVVSIDWVISKLKERYRKAEIWNLTNNLSDLWDDNRIDDAMNLLRSKSNEIEKNTMSYASSWDTGEYDRFLSMINDEIINNHYRGYSIGWPMLDTYTGGLKPGYLAFIAARPKRQKTFMHIQSFIEQIKQGHNPIYFTLELTHREMMLRFMCMITGYPWDKAQRGDYGPKDMKYIKGEWQKFIDQYGTANIIQPGPDERTVAQLMIQAEKFKADSIFISQLKYIQPVRQYKNVHEGHAEVVLDLKQQATKLSWEKPIYVEAQLSREAKNVKELQEMDLAQLGLTDAIGQTADVVYGIVQTQDQYDSGVLEMGVIEARNHGKKSWLFESEFRSTTYIKCQGFKDDM